MSGEAKWISRSHALRRTSPKGKGQEFVGICTQCGTPNLTLRSLNELCPNQRDQTIGDAIIEAIEDRRT